MAITNLTATDDSYEDSAALEQVDGLEGSDTAKISASIDDVTGFSLSADGFTVVSISGTDAIELKNFERIVFNDGVLVADGSGGWGLEDTASVLTDSTSVPDSSQSVPDSGSSDAAGLLAAASAAVDSSGVSSGTVGIISDFTVLTTGDDSYTDQPGAELIDGGDGYDTVLVHETADILDGTITPDQAALTLLGDPAITVRNIERVTFNDESYIRDQDGTWHVEWTTRYPKITADGFSQMTPGSDSYMPASDNEKIDGGGGTDTITISALAADIAGVAFDGQTTVITLNGGATVNLRNVERVAFTDAIFVTDGNGNWHTETSDGSLQSPAAPITDGFVSLTSGDDNHDVSGNGEMIDGLDGSDVVNLPLASTQLASVAYDGGTSLLSFQDGSALAIRNVEYVAFTDAVYATDGAGNWEIAAQPASAAPPSIDSTEPAITSLTAADDTYTNLAGHEAVDGGDGFDTVMINDSSAMLNGIITPDVAALTMYGLAEITLRNVERVMFTDKTFIKASDGSWHVETPASDASAVDSSAIQPTDSEAVQMDDAAAAQSLSGTGANDVFAVAAPAAGYDLQQDAASGSFLLTSPEGITDTLAGFEVIRFVDADYPLTVDPAA